MKKLLLLTGLILLLLPRPAWAHALQGQLTIKGDKIKVEAFFPGNTPAQEAQVVLFHDLDRKTRLVEVKTDENGVCSLCCPEPGKYVIVVDAGGGHRKEFSMEILVRPETRDRIPSNSRDASEFGSISEACQTSDGEDSDRVRICGTCCNRDDLTAYPWRLVFKGLASIAAMALFLWLMARPLPVK